MSLPALMPFQAGAEASVRYQSALKFPVLILYCPDQDVTLLQPFQYTEKVMAPPLLAP